MGVSQVVIVGRPNVGKSSVFNWLAGKRLAIVDNTAGVTRDRVSHLLLEDDRYFELVDTGGIGGNDVDNLTKEIDEQIEIGIDTADVILLILDARSGLMPLDNDIANRLRYGGKPILCVVNKTDHPRLEAQAEEFHRLGLGKLVQVSALANRNRQELMEAILEKLPTSVPEEEQDDIEEPVMKVAIVGRQNVGKSTFVNTLAKAERMIVSEVPGTTRDSVDVRFDLDGKKFMAIDTPGLKRSKSIRTDIDFYSTHRAQRSIRRADVVLMFFDPSQRISKVDKQLCKYVADQFKPCVFVVNKWDLLAEHMPTEKWVRYLRDTFPTMWHVPIGFITGQTGKNVKALINHAQMLFKQSRERITTGQLNRLVRAAIQRTPPPMHNGRRPKIYYATQVGVQPPTIVMMCNDPQSFAPSYRSYLMGVFRDQLSFGEVPIKLYLQKRPQGDERDNIGMVQRMLHSEQLASQQADDALEDAFEQNEQAQAEEASE